MQEKFGRQATERAIWVSFSSLIFFVVASHIHMLYEPSAYDTSRLAYEYLLTPAPRIMLASLITFFIVQQFDSRLYGFFRHTFSAIPMIWVECGDDVLKSTAGYYFI